MFRLRFVSMTILLGLMVAMRSPALHVEGSMDSGDTGVDSSNATLEGSYVEMSTTGGDVKGLIQDGVKRFVGIPFAKPPVGELRFKPPAKSDPWEGLKDAIKLPNSCWQSIDDTFDKFEGVDMWNPNTPRSEDCLYLNVWSPLQAENLPIIVWIFGGGYWSGSSTLDSYNPTALVRMQNVIVVSMNYRVGPFGFLYSGDEAPGNVGLLDQNMAMQWVKDNAIAMGGDPDRITIMGESAGGASVGFHLLSPLSKNLFKYAIMMSGSPLMSLVLQSREKALGRFKVLAKNVGCPDGSNDAVTDCLRHVDPSNLTSAQWSVMDGSYMDTTFAVVPGDTFLPQHPAVLMAKGEAKKTPVITGVVANEGIYWLLYGFPKAFKRQDPNSVSDDQFREVLSEILKQHGTDTEVIRNFTSMIYRDFLPQIDRPSNLRALDYISGDILFKCPSLEFASQFSLGGCDSRTYVYSFNHRTQDMPWPKYFGVAHGYEITSFFGRPWLKKATFSDFDRQASAATMYYIGNFARTGNPNTRSPKIETNSYATWTPFSVTSEMFMNLDIKPTAGEGLRYEECSYWKYGVPMLEGL